MRHKVASIHLIFQALGSFLAYINKLCVMRRTVAYIVIFLTLASCGDKSNSNYIETEIEIGAFTFQFPQDFKLIKEQGIDSYVGKVSNGKIDFQFDYGYYSNSLDKSIAEYLEQDVWKWNALGRYGLLPSGTELSGIAKETALISCQTEDSIKYINFYMFKGDTLSYKLTIPKEILETKIEIDTIDSVVYKYVRKSNYVGLYAKNLRGFNKSINSYLALSIVASDLNKEETEIAYEILRSCKRQK